MLDTDDPFNTRKKKPLLPTSPSSLDDLPLTGNRTAQRLTRYPDNSDPEAGKENTHDAHAESKEADDPPSRITAPPPSRSRANLASPSARA